MDRFGYTLGWGEEIREKLLNVGIRACMEERSRHLGEDTRKVYEENKEEVKASFYKAVDAVGRQVKELQEAGVKSAICYIHISYRRAQNQDRFLRQAPFCRPERSRRFLGLQYALSGI